MNNLFSEYGESIGKVVPKILKGWRNLKIEMVPVLIEKAVIVLITIYPQSWTAVVPLVSKIGVIEVRTVRSGKTLPDNDATIQNLYHVE